MATTFGTEFGERMAVTRFVEGKWSVTSMHPTQALSLHPGTHALHYGSSCFEGLKAHRGSDGKVRIFRLDMHVARMRHSAAGLCLPVPEAAQLTEMIIETVRVNLSAVPAAPGSLYLRPTLLGTDENIGAAATPSATALLYVLASPVGAYFSGNLKLVVETQIPRTTPHFGRIKTGANYLMALPRLLQAKAEHGAHQVLFAPCGEVQETGASNIVLVDDRQIVTPALTDDFLHGVTRDSVLAVARDLGYAVHERKVDLDTLMDWMPRGEVALSGTAAVLAPVEELIVPSPHRVSRGTQHDHTNRLRDRLRAIQTADAPDTHGWLTVVE